MKKAFFLFICFLTNISLLNAQQTVADSLLNLLNGAPADTNKVNTLNALTLLITKNDAPLALEYASEAYEISSQLNFKAGMAKSLNNSGNAYLNMSHYDSALVFYDKALKIATQIGLKKTIGGTLSNIGFIYSLKGDYNKALYYYKRSLKIKEELKDQKPISIGLNKLGAVYFSQGNYPLALENFLKALKIDENINNDEGISNGLNNTALVYHKMTNYTLALEYNEKALKIDWKHNNKQGAATSLNNIGTIYLDMKNYPEALNYFRQALKIREMINDKQGMAATLRNIGLIQSAQNKYEEAIITFKKALKINEDIENGYGISTLQINIAEVYNKLHNYTDALNYALKGFALSKKMDAIDLQEKASSAASIAAAALGQYQTAYSFYKIYKEMNDSLTSEKNVRKLTELELQSKFETQQKALQLEQAKKDFKINSELQNQTFQRNSLIAGFGVVFIVALLLFKDYRTKQKANTKLQTAYKQIEEQHKDIKDSIKYAQRIQEAIIPHNLFKETFGEKGFVLFKPKDIVSGDFYWVAPLYPLEGGENKLPGLTKPLPFGKDLGGTSILFAAVDCTGHGVPGAFMSIVGNNLLNQAVNEHYKIKPAEILDELNKGLNSTLKQTFEDSAVKDGMDIALCNLSLFGEPALSLSKGGKVEETYILQFAGANNPLWIVRNNELIEIKGDKQAVGAFLDGGLKPFTNHEIPLYKNDAIYIFSDGYADQFGGEKGKKFKYQKFKDLLLSIQDKTMKDQCEILNNSFEAWKGELEQVDDVLIIGVKI